VATQTGTTSAESIGSSKTLKEEEVGILFLIVKEITEEVIQKPPSERNGDVSEHKPEPLPEGTYQTPTGAISPPEEPLASGASKPLVFAMVRDEL
jgi:hypothetical protein